MKIEDLDFSKTNGLLPVIVQEVKTLKILMLAYANYDAVVKTLKTGCANYYSRSRKALWKKGETSGNTQKIIDILVDCDSDTLIYIVNQKGVACHTGKYTCFNSKLSK